MTPYFEQDGVTLYHGDCREILPGLPDESVSAVVTDPPYGLAFMGKRWDYDVPSVEVWAECLRVLKPGGHLLAFAGTRTQHRMAVRIEDAGFEIRDMIAWVYGSGFPKSLDVSKAIDKRGGASVAWFGPWFRKWREDNGVTQKQVAALFPSKTGGLTGCVANWELGFNMPTPEQFNLIRDAFALPFASVEEAEREVVGFQARGRSVNTDFMSGGNDITAPATPEAQQWQGWGTSLKPALEPITVARKPLIGTVAENVLQHGTGALNVDGCRVGETVETWPKSRSYHSVRGPKPRGAHGSGDGDTVSTGTAPSGRWPANLIHDGSEEVTGLFPETAGKVGMSKHGSGTNGIYGKFARTDQSLVVDGVSDSGSAARFFYTAKADKSDRGPGNNHPTVKPLDLMRYLVRLVCPIGGVVLDPFSGSGTTLAAAQAEGCLAIGVEREAAYCEIIKGRFHQRRLF